MTPFGQKLRSLRADRNITQARLAQALDVSPAYLSALEHGRKGAPPWPLVQKVIQYFELIWDEAQEIEDLARQSRPRVVIDTAGLDSQATALVNHFASALPGLDRAALEALEQALLLARQAATARRLEKGIAKPQ